MAENRRCAHVLKRVHIDSDWTLRFFHVTSCIPLEVWRAGLMDVLPERIDHGMVGAAGGLGRDGLGAALLMRGLSSVLIPAGDEPLSLETDLRLFDGLAALAARMWGWEDTVGLLPLSNRWLSSAMPTSRPSAVWVGRMRCRGSPPRVGCASSSGRHLMWARWCVRCAPTRGATCRGGVDHPAHLPARRLEARQPGSARRCSRRIARLDAVRPGTRLLRARLVLLR